MESTLQVALKEWAIVCEALARGEQVLLLRKGGIAEDGGVFRIEHRDFFLYPTFEHQHRELIRPEHHARFDRLLAEGANRPGASELVLEYGAQVADILVAGSREQLERLRDHYLWSDRYLEQRFRYKPQLPLYAVVVRAWRLAEPLRVPVLPHYAGCKSWVVLDRALPTAGARPVLDDVRFEAERQAIRSVLLGESAAAAKPAPAGEPV